LTTPRTRRLSAEIPDVEAHLDPAARQLADPRVAPWHGGARDRDQALAMLEAQAEQQAREGYCLWWWRERESGELVGWTGLNRDRVEGLPVVEVGWSITPSCWGRGLATEAGLASIEWGFSRASLERIVSFSLPHNLPSRRVMEKLGMGYVREFERRGLPHVLYVVEARPPGHHR
jgi:RimJ/RimL family protein N-acetyltransferase